jgi:hypothetical protein
MPSKSPTDAKTAMDLANPPHQHPAVHRGARALA